ncbi:tRNA (guanine-N7-)-methyltransferase [Spraguea lophii 42_110]|uniref:tRNA (guanine-N(7)-)-methyltransferase n=1 Tax=Spraguea lophii (strain 42_110) TaxID=1358809 RepID=S7XRS6_SPRLO|nr:tRNA (guanine-N7-)-methyltransferase [Spraguea lophii 42_110]
MEKPRKKDYRQRAHANPFGDKEMFYPPSPYTFDWTKYFPTNEPPKYLDIGCGYGKFLIARSHEARSMGIEIRKKVVAYVEKIKNDNCCVVRTNCFFFLPNFFKENSLEKIFILFPDPHFKKRKYKARVVSKGMIQIYRYILQNKGRLYISTDVKELFDDMKTKIEEFKEFKEVDDVLRDEIENNTDEANRAGKKAGKVFSAIFELNDK